MEAMKRIILILGSLFLGYAVFAHPADRYFDDDDYDDGDLYEWGVQINNYAAPYSDRRATCWPESNCRADRDIRCAP